MSNPSDWMQLYQTNFTNINQIEVSPPTTTTTTTTTTSRNNNLTLDQGRIAKPVRRRSRALQHTPTTIVNTDTTNFQAMVQQFTGGPSARSQLSGHIRTFDFTQHDASTTTFVSPTRGFHVEYPNQMQQYNMFMIHDNMIGGGEGGDSGRVSSAAPPGTSSINDNQSCDHNHMV